MKNIVLIAPPAAGKGTHAKIIAERHNIPSISTGELLRDIINSDNPEGKEYKKLIDQGILINDDIMYDLLKSRLSEPDCDNGFILDGFPRTGEQAILYINLMKELNKENGMVIVLCLSLKTALERLSGRLVCLNCGATYNTNNKEMMPKVKGICDVCGNELTKRSDDKEETLKIRYDNFIRDEEAIVSVLEDSMNIHYIDSTDFTITDAAIEEVILKENNID